MNNVISEPFISSDCFTYVLYRCLIQQFASVSVLLCNTLLDKGGKVH